MRKPLLVLLLLFLSGCAGTEDLLKAPRPAPAAELLQTRIEQLLSERFVYAPPQTGDVHQAVQTVDLAHNGGNEVLLLMKDNRGTVRVCLFRRAEDNTYRDLPPLDFAGETILSVSFADFDGDGVDEIIFSVGIGEVTVLQICTLHEDALTILSPGIAQDGFAVLSAGSTTLCALTTEAESAGCARFFRWDGDSMEECGQTPLSAYLSEVRQILVGTVSTGDPALYVTAAFDPPHGIGLPPKGECTDVILLRDDQFINITLQQPSGVSSETTAQNLDLRPMEIDGMTQIPRSIALPPYPLTVPSDGSFFRTQWVVLSPEGKARETFSAYVDLEGGWFLILRDDFPSSFAVRRGVNETPLSRTLFTEFASIGTTDTAVAFLTIWDNISKTDEDPSVPGTILLTDDMRFSAETHGDLLVPDVLKTLFRYIDA